MNLFFTLCRITTIFGTLVFGYNLEERLPIYKIGSDGSTFGFSVAMHKTSNRDENFVDGSVLVIGSPTADALPSQIHAVKPGGVFYCPVSTTHNDCVRINMDNGASGKSGNKTDQWLGVQVKSEGPGKHLVTCAHRFSKSINEGETESQNVCGKCFLLQGTPQNTIEDITEESRKDFKASPCDNADGQYLYNKNALAFTQAGTSISIANGEYILGGPGAYAWSGAMFCHHLPGFAGDARNGKMFQTTACDSNEINNAALVKCREIPLRRDSYIGFSTAISNAMSYSNKTIYITGAPRGNFNGSVIMYEKKRKNNKTDQLTVIKKDTMMGEHYGSSYGYSVIVTDLNADGLDDLIVGAPQFYEYSDKGKLGGAVYIYINKRTAKFSWIVPQKIYGVLGSFFGQTLAALGDIDQDGYNDLAIGAPFDGDGKVFIYRGSSSGVVTLSQVLDGNNYTDVTSDMSAFGISLSSDVDIDNNGYPDLLVGTLKDQAVLFRSRPIISIKSTLNVSKHVIDLKDPKCSYGGEVYSCFKIQLCFEYQSRHSEFAQALPIHYTISLDNSKIQENEKPRVHFSSSESSVLRADTTIRRSEFLHCLEEQNVYFRQNIVDKLSPIRVYFEFSLLSSNREISPQPEGVPLMNMIEDPILDRKYPNSKVDTVTIMNNCGTDGCQSNLEINGSVPKEILVGTDKKIVMKLNISNTGEEAHGASISIKLPRHIFFDKATVVTPSGPEIECIARSSLNTSTYITCELGNPYGTGRADQLEILLDVSSLTALEKEEVFEITGSTTSKNKEQLYLRLTSKIIAEMNLSLKGFGTPQQVRYTVEPILGESAIKFSDEIGPLITHTFIVKNEGRLIVNRSLLKIDFPFEILNGKWLLYLISTSVTSGGGVAAGTCTSTYTNPLKYKPAPPSVRNSRRNKRQADDGTASPLYNFQRVVTPSTAGSSRSTLHLNCQKKTAQCISITCELGTLHRGRSVSVVLKSHLWNATFLEEFKNVDLVYVGLRGELASDASNIRIVGNETTKEIDTTVDHAFFEEDDITSTFPWWYILIGIIIIFLVYALIIYVLIRCGFFKRRRRYPVHEEPENEKLVRERRRDAEEEL